MQVTLGRPLASWRGRSAEAELAGMAVDSWRRDGYCVGQGLLSEAEVLAFRQRALDLARRLHGEKFVNAEIPLDLLSDPVLRSFVLDQRILGLARDLIGPRLVYFGDSKVAIRNTRGTFHKDNGLRGSWPRGPGYDPFDPGEGPYDVLRVFLYLQDHREFAGNLRVRRGSHRRPVSNFAVWPRDVVFWLTGRLKAFPGPPAGRRINVNSALGDVVVFNLRTTHGTNAVRIKGLPDLAIDPTIERFVPRFMRAPELPFRMSLMVTLGAPGIHLDRFIQSRIGKAAGKDRYRNATFDSPEIRRLADRAGLALRFDLIQRAHAETHRDVG
jgi:hypothetical protein